MTKHQDDLSHVADALHEKFCTQDHGAMYCMYGTGSLGGKLDTEKWHGEAQKLINFSNKNKIPINLLIKLINLLPE